MCCKGWDWIWREFAWRWRSMLVQVPRQRWSRTFRTRHEPKKVLALAGKEAEALNHSYIGTEHILLGLLREGEGIAARVLRSLEVDPARTRNEILKELDPNFTPPESEAESPQEGDKRDVRTPALRAFGRDLT